MAPAMSERESVVTSERIGDIIERAVEIAPADERTKFARFVGVEHLDPDDIKLRRWGSVDEDVLPPTFRYVFRSGMVLFPTRRPALRKCARATFDGITGEKLLVLVSRDPDRLHPKFVPHILASPLVLRWVVERAVGSVTPHFRWSDLAECIVPIPPIVAQVKAAEILDCALELDDDLAHATTCVHAIQAALLEDHFTAHADPSISVFDRVRALSGGTPSRGDERYWSGAVPWLSPKDMKSDILKETSEHISMSAVDEGHTMAPAGTTFIVIRGMILQHSFPVCRSLVPMAFNQDVKALVPADGLEPEYLTLWCRWAAPRLLRMVSETTHGTKRLESDRLGSVPFSSARVPVQRALVCKLEGLGRALTELDQRRATLRRMRRSLLARLRLE